MVIGNKSFCMLVFFIHSPAPLCSVHSVIKGQGQGARSNCSVTGVESDFGQIPRGVWPPFVHLLMIGHLFTQT